MATTTAAPDLMTTKEVAALIRKTPHAVRQMRHRGIGPRGTRVGRDTLYPRDGVMAWLRALEQADPLAQRSAA
ncbi:helix-turn-helix domain-containing protein [Streptomyces drozdowiczii]|uniref:Helix-turn-helix domain-containing protein n=1 Tax=Streptomyces drozdowiczii TaxID=202862 RepID=A0ABY6PPC0_9ACTN|nr:helix-turn-helix domain-containing protein [Streptomyces drozdowiczii]MCX0246450.1 helix-turn-helix domain-containing protein [Streptomyces drozdowiczii]UZK54047.1 helix-turn-helix domain-containing protein [Streptomyces drozdowiczii]